MKLLLVSAAILLIFLAGCAKQVENAELVTECCAQCAAGLSQDPVGVGPQIIPCSKYANMPTVDEYGALTSESKLTPECTEFFKKNNMMAAECVLNPNPTNVVG